MRSVTKDLSFLLTFFLFTETVFDKRMVVIPDGFILPFKTDGAIKLVEISQQPPG